MRRNLDEIKEKLNEGLEVERDIDNFITDWEKNRKIRPLNLLETAKAKFVYFQAPIIALSTVFGMTFLIICLIHGPPTETRSGWHPHQFHTGCLQFGNSQIRICSSYGYNFTNAPIVRYDLNSHMEPCYLGLSKCKRDAEETLNQVAELQRELDK